MQEKHRQALGKFLAADHASILRGIARGDDDKAHDLATRILFGNGDEPPAFFHKYKPEEANLLPRFITFAKGYASHMGEAERRHKTVPFSRLKNDGASAAMVPSAALRKPQKPSKYTPAQFARRNQLASFADRIGAILGQPARFAAGQRPRNGLVELPFGGGLMAKAKRAPGLEEQHVRDIDDPSPVRIKPLAPKAPLGRGPFAGTGDERGHGDGVRYRIADAAGNPHEDAPMAFLENMAIGKALRGMGVPVDHPLVGREAVQRHAEAASHALREHLGDERAYEYADATRSPDHVDLNRLGRAARGLMELVREKHPWLALYDQIAQAHDAMREPPAPEPEPVPEAAPVYEDIDVQPWLWPSPEAKPQPPEDFAPPTIRKPTAKELRPVRVRQPQDAKSRQERTATMEDLLSRKASREQAIQELKDRHDLGHTQAADAWRRFIAGKAAEKLGKLTGRAGNRGAKKMSHGHEPARFSAGAMRTLSRLGRLLGRPGDYCKTSQGANQNDDAGLCASGRSNPDRMTKMRAPAGGFVAQNLFYPGGRLLPLEATGQAPARMSAGQQRRPSAIAGKAWFFTVGGAKPKKFAANEGGPAPGPGSGKVYGYGFSSPNTDQIDLTGATLNLGGRSQERHVRLVENLLRSKGIDPKDYRVYNAVGDWAQVGQKPGAENSTMHVIHRPLDAQTQEQIAAHIGDVQDQVSVLTFRPHDDGADRLSRVFIPPRTNVRNIRQFLSKYGIGHRTVIPVKGGAHVLFVAEPFGVSEETADRLEYLAKKIGGGRVDRANGTAKFVGDESVDSKRPDGKRWTSADSREVYRRILEMGR